MNLLGDFQTPPELAAAVLAACRARDCRPARVLEPTCGSGAFLRAASRIFPQSELQGVEYQRDRYGPALDELVRAEPRLSVRYANAYATDFATLPWSTAGPLLVTGNPPWITAAALGSAAGHPIQPPRSNVKGLHGLAARTGAANFDVAEFLLLKLLRELGAERLEIAVLLKESVARNVIAAAVQLKLGVTSAELVRIDARAWFGVAVDACCLFLSARPDGRLSEPAAIRAHFDGPLVGVYAPAMVPPPARGAIVFRQGIKHDAADVFELRRNREDGWRNGYGEVVDVEADHVYPLRKARALHSGAIEPTALIVPQHRLGESTAVLEARAPRLWRYLERHAARIAARKSSIYRSAPRFALFGVGPYSFAPWKVAVAGFYAEPRFRLIPPEAGRPVVFGDTAYFVGFEREQDARAFAQLAQSPQLAALLRDRIVRGKRPITKALLDGIDWPAFATTLDAPDRVLRMLRQPAAS